MFTRCMLCKEKSIETMEKINCNHGKLNEHYGKKTMTTFGKSMNTMEKLSKNMEKSMNRANGKC